MFKFLKLYDVGYKKIRVGPKKDGGYILLKEPSKNIKNLLSFGVEDNIDFEIDFNKKFKPRKISLFDHTVNKLPKKTKFSFIKKGLSDKKNKKFETLKSISKNFDNNNILKMDIEFDEWKIFENIEIETLIKFKQIICEFHLFFLEKKDVDSDKKLTPYFKNFSINNYEKINKMLLHRYETVFKKLNQYFTTYHLSANNSLPLKKLFGKKFPQLIEISFVRNDLINKKKLYEGKLPIKNLDFANKTYKRDLKKFYPF